MAKARGLPAGYGPSDPLVLFRRIPGTNRYYDPRTYESHSEYFVRRYRASRTDSERQAIRDYGRQTTARRTETRRSIASSYARKLNAEGREFNRNREIELQVLYNRIQELKLEDQRLLRANDNEARDALLAPNGEYARILERLGRRPADADYLVGMSPVGISERVS